HQALARGAHNQLIVSLLLVITPDVLRYYQRYRVCAVPMDEVCFEHRELLRCVRERDEEGCVAMLRRHLKSIREFSHTNNQENHFLE
ncbi:MAG: FCD domain-containing protein, partial [Alistipes sp.]|nr:FCD domain-containing protein [Alistipes sp.]